MKFSGPTWLHFCAALAVLVLSACAQFGKVSTPESKHAIIGRWSAPIDGNPGFVREFFRDGTVKVWWPNGSLAAEGKFFFVEDTVVGVTYPNRDTDVVRIIGGDRIQIDHVNHGGSFRKYFAERQR